LTASKDEQIPPSFCSIGGSAGGSGSLDTTGAGAEGRAAALTEAAADCSVAEPAGTLTVVCGVEGEPAQCAVSASKMADAGTHAIRK